MIRRLIILAPICLAACAAAPKPADPAPPPVDQCKPFPDKVWQEIIAALSTSRIPAVDAMDIATAIKQCQQPPEKK